MAHWSDEHFHGPLAMSPSRLDHITVTAGSLEAGSALVSQVLGVAPQPGGEHPRMATHNLLLRLGDALFLEVIAVNRSVPPPARPRWFALDHLTPESPPRLSTWVVRTPDIQTVSSAASEPMGPVEPMHRGALNWLITIPEDGSVPLDGVGPSLIEWHTDIHPASRLEDHGLSLDRLEIFHPHPERVSRLLTSLQLDAPVRVLPAERGTGARLKAHIHTPWGVKVL